MGATRFWAKLPTRPILSARALRTLNVGELGVAVTALKIYLAVVTEVRNDSGPGSLGPGRARMSYSDLQEVTGASRAMIRPALDRLGPLMRIVPDAGRVHVYELVDFPEPKKPGWVKVPSGFLRGRKVIERFDPRMRTDLSALKLYLLIAALQNKDDGYSRVAYEKITHYTGLHRTDTSHGISRLIDVGMASVHSGRDKSDAENPGHNRYRVLGLTTRDIVPGDVEVDFS